jgi:hypothetical protein
MRKGRSKLWWGGEKWRVGSTKLDGNSGGDNYMTLTGFLPK